MALDSHHLTDGSLVTYYQEIKGKKRLEIHVHMERFLYKQYTLYFSQNYQKYKWFATTVINSHKPYEILDKI